MSPAPQPAARNSSHFGGRAGPRPTQRLAEADVAQQAREHWPRSAPEACSSCTVAQPAARSSSSCGSVPCSSVDTRASPIRRPEAAVVLPFALHHADRALLAAHFTNQ